MGERAQALADRFATANAEFIALVQQIPDANWVRMASAGDPRQVGVLARHIAWGYTFEVSYFQAIADGHPRPPVQDIDAVNSQLAQEWQSTSKTEVLLELAAAAEAAGQWVRGLTDEQLGQSGEYVAGRPTRTVEEFIDRLLIGHISMHLDDVRSALET